MSGTEPKEFGVLKGRRARGESGVTRQSAREVIMSQSQKPSLRLPSWREGGRKKSFSFSPVRAGIYIYVHVRAGSKKKDGEVKIEPTIKKKGSWGGAALGMSRQGALTKQ